MKKVLLVLTCFVFMSWNQTFYAMQPPPIKTHKVIVRSGEIYQNITFPVGTEMSVTDGGCVVYVWPSEDFVMNGCEVKRGTQLIIDDNGTLRNCGRRRVR